MAKITPAYKAQLEYRSKILAGAAEGMDVYFKLREPDGKDIINKWSLTCSPSWDWDLYLYKVEKPKPLRKPFTPEDVPPGSYLKPVNTTTTVWATVLRVSPTKVYTSSAQPTFEILMDNWRILCQGGTGWKPCYHEVPEEENEIAAE